MQRLIFITQEIVGKSHSEMTLQACYAGVRWIQLRMKSASQKVLLEEARKCKNICDDFGVTLTINDHVEVASEMGVSVHVGKQDMPLVEVREKLGQQEVIGTTANTLEDVRKSHSFGADYIGLGPYRFTTTKKKLSPHLGLDGYRKICHDQIVKDLNIPIFAIGGVEIEDINDLMDAGVYGIACSGLLARNYARMEEVVKQIQDKIGYA